MIKEKEWILLQDELPRIGCGWRQLEVTYGRKWVYIVYTPIPGYQATNYKVPFAKWNTLLAGTMRHRKRNDSGDTRYE